MTLKPRLDAKAAQANMAEATPAYRGQEARVEALRCLYCFDAPCIYSCPTGIDIPSFIKQIAEGRDAAAARTILQANVLGASCARVCPTEVLCEGACVMLDRDHQAIEIGRLQRHATDYVSDRKIQVLTANSTQTGHKVACVGGGPASLSCAAELAQLGHQVTVFERQEQAGGLNTYGVAYYKMPPRVSLEEVWMIESLGVEIRNGVEVGVDVSGEELLQQFDAVFLGIGLGRTHSLGLEGEDLPGVVEALDFIKQIRTQPLHEVSVGRRVAVIGCGNTAIDAVTQSKRLGAELRQSFIAVARNRCPPINLNMSWRSEMVPSSSFVVNRWRSSVTTRSTDCAWRRPRSAMTVELQSTVRTRSTWSSTW